MKAAADVAAITGVVFIPPGLTMEQAMIGLHANVKRIRAMNTIDMVRAIGAVVSESNTLGHVLKDAGMSDDQVLSAMVDRWKATRR